MTVEFPKKLAFLFEPHPGKVAYGGRDGTKSWGFATALVEQASSLSYWRGLGRNKLRILCARETQKSIDASVHQLLSDTIERLQLQDRFTIQEQRIVCHANGSEFIFAGLRHNPAAIKSAEGVDIVWVEEAQSVSKDSWSKLIPTVRKPGSEIWVSLNPELDTDDTFVRWILRPVPGTVVVKIGWEDNRWLSERSRVAIDHMRATSPADFAHIYGGECRSSVQGAIFAEELKKVTAEGRITEVPYNRMRPVETAWDLGFHDNTSVWFFQAYDGFVNFIDYLEGSGLTIADYLVQLQGKGYVYGQDWLPHDSVDTIIHKHLAGGDKSKSIEMLMRGAGRKVRVTPKLYVTDRINAARTLFPQCRFDAEKCADGVQALRHYQWGPIVEGLSAPGKPVYKGREPLHSWASHGADAFCYAAIAAKQPKLERKPVEDRRIPLSAWS